MDDVDGNTTTQVITPAPGPPSIGYYGDMRETLWRILPPIIMAWGTIGNVLTFLVILRQTKTLSSTAIYLMALAVSDTVVLYTGPLRQWVKIVYDIDIRDITEAGCRSQIYITYASLHMSSWLLVAVSLERALCVVIPHKVKLTCTKTNACLIIIAMFVLIFGINAVIPVMYGLKGVRNQKCSVTTTEFLDFRDNIWQWIDFCLTFAVPFIILVVCNSIILVSLRRSQAKSRNMVAGNRIGARSGRNMNSVSILMIALCLIFFVTMTPASIFAVYYPYRYEAILELFKTDKIAAWYDYQYLMFQHAVVTMVSYTNAAFNFILYVFSGTKFRNELYAMFTCRKPGKYGMMDSKVKTTSTVMTSSPPTERRTDSDFRSSVTQETSEDSIDVKL